jgi:hypothetical protein
MRRNDVGGQRQQSVLAILQFGHLVFPDFEQRLRSYYCTISLLRSSIAVRNCG